MCVKTGLSQLQSAWGLKTELKKMTNREAMFLLQYNDMPVHSLLYNVQKVHSLQGAYGLGWVNSCAGVVIPWWPIKMAENLTIQSNQEKRLLVVMDLVNLRSETSAALIIHSLHTATIASRIVYIKFMLGCNVYFFKNLYCISIKTPS